MFSEGKTTRWIKRQNLIYLQHDGQSVCDHLNGPERVHHVFQLVLPEDPVWCEPGKHRTAVSVERTRIRTYMPTSNALRCERTWVGVGTCEAWLGCRSSRWPRRSSSASSRFFLRPSCVCGQWGGKCCESCPSTWEASSPPKQDGFKKNKKINVSLPLQILRRFCWNQSVLSLYKSHWIYQRDTECCWSVWDILWTFLAVHT